MTPDTNMTQSATLVLLGSFGLIAMFIAPVLVGGHLQIVFIIADMIFHGSGTC